MTAPRPSVMTLGEPVRDFQLAVWLKVVMLTTIEELPNYSLQSDLAKNLLSFSKNEEFAFSKYFPTSIFIHK